jgi:hypothetical protein
MDGDRSTAHLTVTVSQTRSTRWLFAAPLITPRPIGSIEPGNACDGCDMFGTIGKHRAIIRLDEFVPLPGGFVTRHRSRSPVPRAGVWSGLGRWPSWCDHGDRLRLSRDERSAFLL